MTVKGLTIDKDIPNIDTSPSVTKDARAQPTAPTIAAVKGVAASNTTKLTKLRTKGVSQGPSKTLAFETFLVSQPHVAQNSQPPPTKHAAASETTLLNNPGAHSRTYGGWYCSCEVCGVDILGTGKYHCATHKEYDVSTQRIRMRIAVTSCKLLKACAYAWICY